VFHQQIQDRDILPLEREEEGDFAISVLRVRICSTFEKQFGKFKIPKRGSTCMMECCVARYIGHIWWRTALKEILEDIKMSKGTRRSSLDALRAKHSKCKKTDIEGRFGSCYVRSTPSADCLN
jgi:hypothetical protein